MRVHVVFQACAVLIFLLIPTGGEIRRKIFSDIVLLFSKDFKCFSYPKARGWHANIT